MDLPRGGVWTIRFCLAIAALAGCATTTGVRLPEPAQQASVIEYVRELRVVTSTLGDAAVVRMLPANADEYPTYRWWWQTWCPRHESLSNGPQLMERIATFCQVHDGAFHEPVCTSAGNESEVLFFARFDRKSATCGGAATSVGVQLAEPKPGVVEPNTAFLEVLHKGGWKSPDERRVTAETQARKDLAALAGDQMAQDEETARIARELPLLKTRGTRVCRTEGNRVWVAFTEDATDKKIQLRIANLHYAGDERRTVANFTPGQIVWDSPERWRICE